MLTIGDGLVTVIPALMISISGGLIVTSLRQFRRPAWGRIPRKQIFSQSGRPLAAGGWSSVRTGDAAWHAQAAVPIWMAGAAGSRRLENARSGKRLATALRRTKKPAAAKENVESLMRVEPLAIEVGLGLVGLVEGAQDSALLRRISAIRKQTGDGTRAICFCPCGLPIICRSAAGSI